MTPPSKQRSKAKREPAVVEPTTQSRPQSVAGPAAARRILVIGLDGATYDILDPMRAEGRMPNLDRLIKEGTAGILYSTKPPITPAAWTTFMTGKGPGRHGIIDFERYDPRTNTLSFNSTYEIREPTIWNILSSKGLRVGSINLPMTFPPKPVNGFLISGFETPSTDVEFTYPPELKDDILSRWPGYTYRTEWQRTAFGGDKLFARNLQYITDSFTQGYELATYCGGRYGWDMMMVLFKLVDNLQHKAWKYLDPATAPRFPRRAKMAAACFNALDKVIGQLADFAAAHDAVVLVMSDHGHGSLDGKAQPNLILRRAGWLTLHGRLAQARTRSAQLANRMMGRRNGRFSGAPLTRDLDVDWSCTKACVMHAGIYGYLYINLKGRQPDGIVAPTEYESLRDVIRQRLLDARCRWPDGTERAIYTEVHKPEDLYGRSRHDDETLPDLMLVPSPGLAVVRKIRGSALVRWSSLRRREGTHRVEGILVAHGPGIRKGQQLNGEIADIAPTILAALGQPVPKDMDGRVLADLFDPPLSVQYEPPVKHSFERTEDTVYTEEEQEALTRRLADLGYL